MPPTDPAVLPRLRFERMIRAALVASRPTADASRHSGACIVIISTVFMTDSYPMIRLDAYRTDIVK